MCGGSEAQAFSLVGTDGRRRIAGLTLAGISAFALYSSRSFGRYGQLHGTWTSRQLALDKFTQQSPPGEQLTSYTTTNGAINSLRFTDYDESER